MSELAAKALSYGSIGLCMVALVGVWRLLILEQARPSAPRKGIVRMCFAFMGFALLVAALAAFVELSSRQRDAAAELQLANLKGQLRQIESTVRLKLRIEVENPKTPLPPGSNLRFVVEQLQHEVRDAIMLAGGQPSL